MFYSVAFYYQTTGERDVASYLFSVHVFYPTMSVDIIWNHPTWYGINRPVCM